LPRIRSGSTGQAYLTAAPMFGAFDGRTALRDHRRPGLLPRFCAACKVPEVISAARTIETWQAAIIAAVQTGLTNDRTKGYNRIVKHVARLAFGFRNPDNQHRRARWA